MTLEANELEAGLWPLNPILKASTLHSTLSID